MAWLGSRLPGGRVAARDPEAARAAGDPAVRTDPADASAASSDDVATTVERPTDGQPTDGRPGPETAASPGAAADGHAGPAPAGGAGLERPPFRAFFAWGVGGYLAILGLALVRSLALTGGRMVYVIDDAAIHLSVARNLADHGTWGVVPGHYESASSSPLWTLLLAGASKVGPGTDAALPLVLNVVFAVVVIALLAATQRVLLPSRRRPADVLGVAALVGVVLFLPGLAMTGMEHSLHIALMLGAVVLFHRAVQGEPRVGPRWLPYVLVALATLTRFETLFVAAGLALALLVAPAPPGTTLVRRLHRPFLVGLAAFGPALAYGAVNKAMGQGWLPNSVLAKAAIDNSGPVTFFKVALERVSADPMVATLGVVTLGALVLAGRRWTPWTLPAVVAGVTVVLHMLFARFGWYERYQAYVIALAAYFLLTALADLLPAAHRPPARSFAVAGLVGVLLLVSGNKPGATFAASEAVGQTYEQRYQAAEFLARYYDGEPIATSELGYISLFHDGPLTDVFGLGDVEVLDAWQEFDGPPPPEFWVDLAAERGFGVVTLYPITLYPNVPEEWIHVGTWTIDRHMTTAPSQEFQFLAADPAAVAPLVDHLTEFAPELPDTVEVDINPLAEFQADVAMAGEAPSGAG